MHAAAGPAPLAPARTSMSARRSRSASTASRACSRSTPCPARRRSVELLAADGVLATQATVSRDLEELGAVKVRVPGGETVYAIPELRQGPGRARGPSAAGARRLGRRGGALGQPGRAAHAAGVGPRGRVGASTGPAWPTSSVPSPATTPAWWWRRNGPVGPKVAPASARSPVSSTDDDGNEDGVRSESYWHTAAASTRRSPCGGWARSWASR